MCVTMQVTAQGQLRIIILMFELAARAKSAKNKIIAKNEHQSVSKGKLVEMFEWKMTINQNVKVYRKTFSSR